MKERHIWRIFWTLVVVFAISMAMMFAPFLPMRYSSFIASPILVVLGVVLSILTVESQMEERLKKFLLMTGASPMGSVVFGYLHNRVSGILKAEDDPVFFILANVVCPVVFVVGAIGSIVLKAKRKTA